MDSFGFSPDLYYLCNKYSHQRMKKHVSWMGIILIVAGTFVLLLSYLLHHTTNAFLTTGFLLIIAGVVGYIHGIKMEG